MNHYTGYELLWLFFIYSFGGWVLETISATLKQRKFGKWTVLCALWSDRNCDDSGITGTSGNLAIYLCNGLCNSCRMGQWTSDRKSIQGKMVGLFKYQMEPGWIYLSSGFTILGCARLSGSEMVQWDHVDFITYSAEASDAYCAADTDRCTFCGHLWFLYASYRKE